MKIPLFLAMTAAELQNAEMLPVHTAWMACHFSSYRTGISNIPKVLPPGSMLMLNDRTPICGHDPDTVAQTLCNTAETLQCERIVLDFQREGFDELHDVVRAVLARAGCPVGVSPLYASELDCPVLVPPISPHITPAEALCAWKGREIWLELSAEGIQIAVTEEGSRYTPLSGDFPGKTFHQEQTLHCHYLITAEENQILFNLIRTDEDQRSLLDTVSALGVTHALGLWQEMNKRQDII